MDFGGVGGGGGGRGQVPRGHVLLLAADAAVRRGGVVLSPGENVAALAMVPPDVLLGCETPADMVVLEGVRDPNTVLARLRAAVAAAGPVFLYVSGRLTADRRGRRLFVALAGTTPGSVRYTSLPWEWLVGELRTRSGGVTTMVVDLVADKAAWPLVCDREALPDGAWAPGVEAYGVVRGPDAPTGGGGVSGYTRQWIDQLRRAPVRPSNVELHVLAAGSAGLEPGTRVVPSARGLEMRRAPAPGHVRREPGPVAAGGVEGDPRARLHALALEGRHGEADALARAWERAVVERWGGTSPEAVRCGEIRADLARMAGDFASATRLWVEAGRARLEWQGAGAAEVRDAAAGALYCWTQVKDRAGALASGPDLVDLLRALPLPDPGHLRLAERRLEALRTPTPRRSDALNLPLNL